MRHIACGLLVLLPGIAVADPCGMVQPTPVGTIPLARTGVQQTYVFFKNGIESFVIRPAYRGKAKEFGMLVPVPSVPAIRKVPDDVFEHINAAIKPPPYVLDLRPQFRFQGRKRAQTYLGQQWPRKPQVEVIKRDTIGMYQAVVLKAGSATALRRWMVTHGYRFPKGMEGTCNAYIRLKWCFVAVKARIKHLGNVDPRPGRRDLLDGPPIDFDGNLQAMGFRFRTPRLVLPMRLSAFNRVSPPGDLPSGGDRIPNQIFVLTDQPVRVRFVGTGVVKRQISGKELIKNMTELVEFISIGGTRDDVHRRWRDILRKRNPDLYNGVAKRLFASDITAAKTNRLALPHEDYDKQVLTVNEQFGLRGEEISRLTDDALKADHNRKVKKTFADLEKMTFTVIEHDFPRQFLARRNLTFVEYRLPAKRNRRAPAHGIYTPLGVSDARQMTWMVAMVLPAMIWMRRRRA